MLPPRRRRAAGFHFGDGRDDGFRRPWWADRCGGLTGRWRADGAVAGWGGGGGLAGRWRADVLASVAGLTRRWKTPRLHRCFRSPVGGGADPGGTMIVRTAVVRNATPKETKAT